MRQKNGEALMSTIILSNLNRAIDLAPDRVRTDSYVLRYYCWDKVGDIEKAYQDRMTVIQREPNNPKRATTYAWLAGELTKRGEYQQAMEYVNRSIVLAPDYALARAIRSLTYVGMGEWDEWEDELKAAIDLDPSITNMCTVQEMFDIVEKKRTAVSPIIQTNELR